MRVDFSITPMQDEKKVFEEYLKKKNLKHSSTREKVVDIFLNIDRHLTAEELYSFVTKKHSAIGFSTVYRTLKLLSECGLCRELKPEDGVTRYEHLYRHQHHDHLICTRGGKFVEIVDTQIENLQKRLFEQHGFHPQKHKMELYGICKKCRKQGR